MGSPITKLSTTGLVVKTPTLPTIPNTTFVPVKSTAPAAQKAAGNGLDWGKLLDNVFTTAGKVIDMRTAQLNQTSGLQDFSGAGGGDTGGSGGGNTDTGISPVMLLAGGGVAAYLLLK